MISNYRFVKNLHPEFIKWVQNKNYFYTQFQRLAHSLRDYYLDRVLSEKDTATNFASHLEDVLPGKDCDKGDFNLEGMVDAYVFWHMLDRYLRFQEIYLKVFEQGVLPIRYSRLNFLDIGTGPAPAIYALSTLYNAIKLYGSENGLPDLCQFSFRPDYAESNNRFRQFVHFFTEVANNQEPKWTVPFHLGNYWDVYSESFKTQNWFRARDGYNFVMFGNFITQKNQAERLYPSFLQLYHRMKNGGIIVMVGNSRDFKDNMTNIGSYLETIKVKPLHINTDHRNKISFDFMGDETTVLNDFYLSISHRIDELGLKRLISDTVMGELQARTTKKRIKASWLCYVYRKGNLPKVHETSAQPLDKG